MPDWLFTSWESAAQVVASGLIGYVGLIVLLRVSGKRTLSKMNAFDFVVTVALGSLLASTTLSGSVPVVNGLLALAMLVAAQYAVTWLTMRSDRFGALVKARPTLLFYDGAFLRDAMRQARVTEGEVLAAIRKNGGLRVEEVGAVVLESEGTLTVMADLGESRGPFGALHPITNPEALPPERRSEKADA